MIEQKAIDALLSLGWTKKGKGLYPPHEFQTITKLMRSTAKPKPSRDTVQRACKAGDLQAYKEGGRWHVNLEAFDEWLKEWRMEHRRFEELDRHLMAVTLGGRYDGEYLMFPDPHGVRLIIIDEAERDNPFVKEFLAFHGESLAPVIYWSPVSPWEPLPGELEAKLERIRRPLWIGKAEPYSGIWHWWYPEPGK